MSSKMNLLESGKIWPWAISLSIVLIVGAGGLTIAKALENPVEESELYMRYYQDTMVNINDIIEAQIAFDKKYDIEFLTQSLATSETIISYKIADKNSEAVNNAKVIVRVTRPNVHAFDIDLTEPLVQNGIYTFKPTTLPKEGRWDIMAKITIGDDYRYYNLKADTRYPQTTEY